MLVDHDITCTMSWRSLLSWELELPVFGCEKAKKAAGHFWHSSPWSQTRRLNLPKLHTGNITFIYVGPMVLLGRLARRRQTINGSQQFLSMRMTCLVTGAQAE